MKPACCGMKSWVPKPYTMRLRPRNGLLCSPESRFGDTEEILRGKSSGPSPSDADSRAVPYPADPNYGWDGWLTVTRRTQSRARLYLHRKFKPDHPLADDISTAYLPAYRKHRIDARIEAEPLHTSESIGDIQMEWLDAHAQERVPQLLAGLDTTQSLCGRLLKEWTFTSTPDSVGAAVWAVFQEELMRVALRERLGEEGFQLYLASAVAGRTVIDANLEAFVPSRDAAVRQALSATCDRLKRRLGPDPASWQWGTLHPLKIQHPFGSQSALLQLNMPVPYGGSSHTINQAAFSFYGASREAAGCLDSRHYTPFRCHQSHLHLSGGRRVSQASTLSDDVCGVSGWKAVPLVFRCRCADSCSALHHVGTRVGIEARSYSRSGCVASPILQGRCHLCTAYASLDQ